MKKDYHKTDKVESKKFDEMVKTFTEGNFKDVGKLGVGYMTNN